MRLDSHDIAVKESRKYVRLDTVFPIEFQVLTKGAKESAELHEGFTRNVGKGGMCIFVKKAKDYKQDKLDLQPKETRLKLIVNIPLDKEPVECSARIEWLERRPGRVVDTYLFGVSYDQIDEKKYKKIIDYVQWLKFKTRFIYSAIAVLLVAATLSLVFLNQANIETEARKKQLVKAVHQGKEVKAAKEKAEEDKAEMENLLKAVVEEHKVVKDEYDRIVEEKRTLEEVTQMREEDRANLEEEVEELTLAKEELENIIEQDEGIETGEEEPADEMKEDVEEGAISAERLKDEEVNYNKFKEFILNEKIQSLAAYVSSHRSSIYHAAALFALAELRYKYGNKVLAEESYEQLIARYPDSKYALYSSHRLDQLYRNNNYENYTLRYFYLTYNLPELTDYRNIEPYVK
ncbi:MAG: PilZ domain-containing protein [Candidatus Omnitrophica bacterium]|nr:PilZ domain-containing protein [Candidatus Omnitrophota bacterium]